MTKDVKYKRQKTKDDDKDNVCAAGPPLSPLQSPAQVSPISFNTPSASIKAKAKAGPKQKSDKSKSKSQTKAKQKQDQSE